MAVSTLTLRFLRRDLRNRFAGSFSGGLWALIQPLLQLAVTSFVFIYVLNVRVPGAEGVGYVTFLAVALWPWTAFADAVMRSTTAIQDNAALIGKVAVPREILVVSSVTSSFVIHIAGFVAVVIVLAMAGRGVHLFGLVPALALFPPLFALALGTALALASIQVFVRDLVQALGVILQLMVYCAPVYYARAQVPERFHIWLDLNPFAYYAETFRVALLHQGDVTLSRTAVAIGVAAATLFVGHRIFTRLDPHFEDYL